MPRSRSRSPRRDSAPRARSRSPRREDRDRDEDRNRDSRDRDRARNRSRERRDKPRSSGFKWKEKRKDDDARDEPKRLERGYRQRSPSPRGRAADKPSSSTSAAKGNSVEDKFGVQDKFGVTDKFGLPKKSNDDSGGKKDAGPPKRPAAATSAPQPTGEPMIIVHVNDRLGTKAAIPCLASDPIRLFKAQVAARIGREPHEILLKRQGERPFKDQLTLEDYGVSNGVQLDLEVDTGD